MYIITWTRNAINYPLNMQEFNKYKRHYISLNLNMNKINDQIKKYKKRIKILENNQKKEKFPEGCYIYVIKGPMVVKMNIK
jgi:hypothetical protein